MKITIHAQNKIEPLNDLYGIFFEDLNHAADGGLYGELVQNRSFEFAPIDHPTYHPLMAWEKIEIDGEVRLVIETGNPVSHKNPHYLGMDVVYPGKNVGILNCGYNSGIPFKQDAQYLFSCYAKREQCFDDPIHVSFRGKEGEIYTNEPIYVTSKWEKYELEITSPITDYDGRLALTIEGRGKVYLDLVSLFPKDTFKGRRNGMRRDIAEKLAALKPKFMRFPGGCLVHDGALDPDARDSMYRWKNTIGPLEDRPARRSNWGYNQTLGLGYYEYFLFCEDINAKPLPVLPGGWDPHHKRAVELDQLQPWIDDALDLIEFANGDLSTTWGKIRADLGHREPFGLEYLGIGNEEVGAEFFERYRVLHEAIKKAYPNIQLINSSGPFPEGEEYDRGWASARENNSEFVDEHYYCSPEWFLANHHRYDHFNADDPKVFLGEYASWGNTFYNALTEASYMIGLEKNAHAVKLACYAPMLCNVDYVNWSPNLVWFNNHEVYGTANYYVQQLFMQYQGTHILECRDTDFPDAVVKSKDPTGLFGDIILKGNESKVQYKDIQFINEDTQKISRYDAVTLEIGEELPLEIVDCVNYTLRFKAKEIEGYKGFHIFFAKEDVSNCLLWEIGGWQNQDAIVVEKVSGRGSCLTQSLFSVQRDQWYEMELQVKGRTIVTKIDNREFPSTECKPVVIEPLYYSASYDNIKNEIYVKIVNVMDKVQDVTLEFINTLIDDAECLLLAGYDLEDTNSLENPENIVPSIQKVLKPEHEQNKIQVTVEKHSINVYKFTL